MMLTMVVGSAIGARLILRVGFRVIVTAGALGVATGTFLLTRLTANPDQLWLNGSLVVLGLGMGLTFISTALAAQNSVTTQRMGVATGLVNFSRQLGGAVGVAIAASVMLTTLVDRLTEAFGAGVVDTSKVLSPANQKEIPPNVRATVADAFAGALHRTFWVACAIAIVGIFCTVLMPRGAAARIRDDARREASLDSLTPDGETFEITSSVA
jgi:MFS family permease